MGIAMARGRSSSEEGNSRSRGSKGGAGNGGKKNLDALGLFDGLFLVVLTFHRIPCPEWKSKLRIIIKKCFFLDRNW